MKRLMLWPVLLAALMLAGCGQKVHWYGTDITGVMPPLKFAMTRATDGAGVTAKDYRGKVALLYFGYTNCPDVCPLTLSNLAAALGKLGEKAKDVSVLFVTVDPDRDTLPVLKKYAAAFAPQVVGLRGSKDAIAALARRYRVAYNVTPASPGHPYTVSHSAAVFFFDPEGKARAVVLDTSDIKGVAGDMRQLLP